MTQTTLKAKTEESLEVLKLAAELNCEAWEARQMMEAQAGRTELDEAIWADDNNTYYYED